MVRIADVAAYILTAAGPMTTMKLQKLCYYAFGYHLAWEERKLFPERFEAWANGPVAPDLYAEHRGLFQLASGDIEGDPEALDAGEKESVTLVVNTLGDLSAHQLSTMTHNESPWQRARERDSATGLERSSEPVSDEDIFEFFDALAALDGQGEA